LNLEAFCYIGLLCFPAQLDGSLSLLPDAEQEQARKILQELQSVPQSEGVQRWSKLRREEYVSMSRSLCQDYGIDLDSLPPSLHPFCTSWWAEHHG
jgi:hypothetical protein